MQIRKIQDNSNYNTTFGIKNTFLNKAMNANSKAERRYWESLHNEAKARLSYRKFIEEEKEYDKFDKNNVLNTLSLFKMLLKMAYRKNETILYDIKAFIKFPKRFAEPDNIRAKYKCC